MVHSKIALLLASTALLAACGGSTTTVTEEFTTETRGTVIEADDVSIAGDVTIDDELTDGSDLNDQLLGDIEISNDPEVASGPLTVGEINGTLANIEELYQPGLVNETDFLTEADLSASGSASYAGIVIVAEYSDDEFSDDMDGFAIGRSLLNIDFGAVPDVSGGAKGFVTVDEDEIAAFEAAFDGDVAERTTLPDGFPLRSTSGEFVYSGGRIISGDNVDGVAFDIDGSVVLPRDTGGSRSVDVGVEAVAAVANDFAVGFAENGDVEIAIFGFAE